MTNPSEAATHGSGVTVVTATRRRPGLLLKAIRSVQRQCCEHVSAHLVLVDACEETWRALESRTDLPNYLTTRFVPRKAGEVTGPVRLGVLRDLGAAMAQTPWLAFLDDDNEWETNHLHALLAAAEVSGSPALHSWMRVVDEQGCPYLNTRIPWARTDEVGRREYARLVRLGVITAGSNVYRDRADPGTGDDAVQSVDGGEWLLRTELARSIGFACEFTDEERDAVIGDDDKFLAKLIAAGTPITASHQATLIYRTGGFSNRFDSDEKVSW